MPIREITFEESGLVEGSPISSITIDGVTVRFLTQVSIFRPRVTTESPPKALINNDQNVFDNTGFQRPIIFEFSHLQHRVWLLAGLNEGSIQNEITARLVAYDSSGHEVSSDTQILGIDPTPIRVRLEVRTSGHLIRRVKLEYNGSVREVIDNLKFQSGASITIPPDRDEPIVNIVRPIEGEQVNSRTILVSGTIREVNGVTLVINGTSVSVQRIDANIYSFNAEVTLPEGTNTIEAIATDEARNIGRDRKAVDIRIPRMFSISDIYFTQNGLLDSGTPLPTRRVAGKTSLFRLRLEIRTADGLPTSVDAAKIVVEGGSSPQLCDGQQRPATGNNQFAWYGYDPIADGQQAYFFIKGGYLDSGYSYRFVLQLSIREYVVFEQALVSDWSFESVSGITILLVPQHRPLDVSYTHALIQTLYEFARMLPVPDGIANLASDEPGGIRFAVLPPASYSEHTDPADNSMIGTSVSYDQGFLLHDHNVASDPGADGIYGTGDEPYSFWSGEYLPIEFTRNEDEDRDGVWDAEELARVVGGDARQSHQRFINWSQFVRQHAESLRQNWNQNHNTRYQSHRAIAIIIGGGTNPQNRTGLLGNAGGGETSYWANIDIDLNAVIAHETGHTFGFGHTDDIGSCVFSDEAINLLTRQISNPGFSVMCSGIGGGSSHYFLTPADYTMLFDRLISAGGLD